MKICKNSNGELSISENIKSIDDYIAIRTTITNMMPETGGELLINIPDSFSMPSSVIGFLIKLVNEHKIRIRLKIGNQNLYELLDEMNLLGTFNVHK